MSFYSSFPPQPDGSRFCKYNSAALPSPTCQRACSIDEQCVSAWQCACDGSWWGPSDTQLDDFLESSLYSLLRLAKLDPPSCIRYVHGMHKTAVGKLGHNVISETSFVKRFETSFALYNLLYKPISLSKRIRG